MYLPLPLYSSFSHHAVAVKGREWLPVTDTISSNVWLVLVPRERRTFTTGNGVNPAPHREYTHYLYYSLGGRPREGRIWDPECFPLAT